MHHGAQIRRRIGENGVNCFFALVMRPVMRSRAGSKLRRIERRRQRRVVDGFKMHDQHRELRFRHRMPFHLRHG